MHLVVAHFLCLLVNEQCNLSVFYLYYFLYICGSSRINNRKLCLIIDDNERDKDRLIQYAAKNGVDAQVRQLPAGDYIWILSPPVMTPDAEYTGRDTDNELVCYIL